MTHTDIPAILSMGWRGIDGPPENDPLFMVDRTQPPISGGVRLQPRMSSVCVENEAHDNLPTNCLDVKEMSTPRWPIDMGMGAIYTL